MNTKTKGNIGENVACEFLMQRGFTIKARNYMKKWGELDIVAIKDKAVHIFEVKSVTFDPVLSIRSHKAEENVHGFKVRQIRRMVETYFAETGRSLDEEFHFHVLSVYLNFVDRRAKVKWIRDVIL